MCLRYCRYNYASIIFNALVKNISGDVSFQFEVYFENLKRLADVENDIFKLGLFWQDSFQKLCQRVDLKQ